MCVFCVLFAFVLEPKACLHRHRAPQPQSSSATELLCHRAPQPQSSSATELLSHRAPQPPTASLLSTSHSMCLSEVVGLRGGDRIRAIPKVVEAGGLRISESAGVHTLSENHDRRTTQLNASLYVQQNNGRGAGPHLYWPTAEGWERCQGLLLEGVRF